nr:transglycosylase domain-containing protein [uncultured Carboxylicivirga sp.]
MPVKKNTPKKRTASKKSKTNNRKKKLILWGLKITGIAIGAGALFVLFVYLGLFGRLPSMEQLAKVQNNTASEVFSVDHQLMGRYFVEQRLTVDNNQVSQNVKNALIATEDSRFFEHNGLDFISFGRVLFRSVFLGDRAQGGGSTISQQLAKNLYPRMRLGFLTLPVGKTKEIFTAARLEDIYSKDDILTLYLNTVPFGEDIYGIEMASRRFFGKHSKELNPAEAATLVGMLAANTAYNPRLHPERSVKRRNIVLRRMNEQGFLKDTEYQKWKQSKLVLHYHRIDHNSGIAPYFRERIRVEAQKILEEKYGDQYDIYSDGLRIFTTINSTLQEYAEQAVHQQMERLQGEFERHWKNRDPWEKHPNIYIDAVRNSHRYKVLEDAGWKEEKIFKHMEQPVSMTIYTASGEKKVTMSPVDSVKHYLRMLNTGFIALDPKNGHVLAWVGGVDHKTSQYDHVTSQRPVGSTFKPIVYTTALDNGMEPCEWISNEQQTYTEYNNWKPSNSNGNHEGYYTLKGGLAKSVNTISAKIITRVGIDKTIDMAHDMGIQSSIPKVPSIALGTAEISLLEMVSAYTTFPNYGRPVEPVMLLRIEDRYGNPLYINENEQEGRQVYDDQVAYFILDMMKGVVERGTGTNLRKLYHLKSDLAGKTGTTQDNSDGWFIGYTPTLVAGAWVGNDQPSIRFRSTALGSGGHMALPVFARFMQRVEGNTSMKQYYATSFYPIPNDLKDRMECDDYSLEDPDKDIFNKMFDSFGRPDSTKIKRREERKSKREEKREKRDHKSVLDRMKDLFKKN